MARELDSLRGAGFVQLSSAWSAAASSATTNFRRSNAEAGVHARSTKTPCRLRRQSRIEPQSNPPQKKPARQAYYAVHAMTRTHETGASQEQAHVPARCVLESSAATCQELRLARQPQRRLPCPSHRRELRRRYPGRPKPPHRHRRKTPDCGVRAGLNVLRVSKRTGSADSSPSIVKPRGSALVSSKIRYKRTCNVGARAQRALQCALTQRSAVSKRTL